MYIIFIFTSEQEALQDYHMPFKFDDSQLVENKVFLLQRGFINRFSKKRKTPIFTAQKLDGKALKTLRENVKIHNYIASS